MLTAVTNAYRRNFDDPDEVLELEHLSRGLDEATTLHRVFEPN